MKGEGEIGSEGTHKNDYGKPNNDIKVTRRTFIKKTAAFGAVVAGVPYNLTDITDVFLKEDGELVMYPVISEYKFELVRKLPFERFICINCWGCNWNCRWCPTKFSIYKDMTPIMISIDSLMRLFINLNTKDKKTLFVISGGEPLLQKKEVLKLIDSLKTETNYTVMLATNGSLIEEDFIERANDLGLDGINLSFRHTDKDWHKYYTGGHSIQSTVDALELVTKKFLGMPVVSLSAWLDTATLENICKFLHEINQNFLIKIFHPRYPPHREEEWKSRYNNTKKIAWRFSLRVEQTSEFSTQIKMIRYQIEEDESGNMELIKGREWIRRKEAMKYG